MQRLKSQRQKLHNEKNELKQKNKTQNSKRYNLPPIFCRILITGTIKHKYPSYSWKSTRIRWNIHHRPQWPRFTRRFSKWWIRFLLLECYCDSQTPNHNLSPPFLIWSNSYFRCRSPQCVSRLNFPSKRPYLSSPSNCSDRSCLTRIYRHASHQRRTKSKENWCNYSYTSPIWSVVSISCI